MKTSNNIPHQWNEIIFKNRNKAYGAYQLRETYDLRVIRALMLCFAFITILIGAPLIISHYFTKVMDVTIAEAPLFEPIPINPDIFKPKIPEPQKPQNNSPQTESTMPLVRNDTMDNKQDSVEVIPEHETFTANAGTYNGENVESFVPPSRGTVAEPPTVRTAWQVDKMPEFPGGNEAFYTFLRKHVNYPALPREEGTEGTVYISFVVNSEGAVTNIKLLRGAGYGFDEEAIRVINKMPNWKPGSWHGEPVSTAMQLPVKFVLVK